MSGINFFGIELKEGHYFNLKNMKQETKVVLLYEIARTGLLYNYNVTTYLSDRYDIIVFGKTHNRGKVFSGDRSIFNHGGMQLNAVLCEAQLHIIEKKPEKVKPKKVVQGSIWDCGLGHKYMMSYIRDGAYTNYALVNTDTGSTWNGLRTENTIEGMGLEGFVCVKCPEGKRGLRD